jgi:hypothetical protein
MSTVFTKKKKKQIKMIKTVSADLSLEGEEKRSRCIQYQNINQTFTYCCHW